MNRINKVTLADQLRPTSYGMKLSHPVFLTITKIGFSMSKGLYNLMESPEYVEFLTGQGKLFITASTRELGFKVTMGNYEKSPSAQFRCRSAQRIYFGEYKGRLTVFTDRVAIVHPDYTLTAFEIRLPQ